jgi:acyl carrier protein
LLIGNIVYYQLKILFFLREGEFFMFEKIKNIVVDQLGVSADEVTLEASIIDDLGADSLDIVELVMAFEEEFGVEIPDEAAEKIATIGDIVSYLEANK